MSINAGALDNSARPVPFGVRVLALFSDHCIAFSTWVFHTLLILSDVSSSLNRGPVNSECACQTVHVKQHACCCGACLTTIVALERVLDQRVHGVLHASCQSSMHERSHGFAVGICNACVHHGSADSQHSVCSVCGSGVVGLPRFCMMTWLCDHSVRSLSGDWRGTGSSPPEPVGSQLFRLCALPLLRLFSRSHSVVLTVGP